MRKSKVTLKLAYGFGLYRRMRQKKRPLLATAEEADDGLPMCVIHDPKAPELRKLFALF